TSLQTFIVTNWLGPQPPNLTHAFICTPSSCASESSEGVSDHPDELPNASIRGEINPVACRASAATTASSPEPGDSMIFPSSFAIDATLLALPLPTAAASKSSEDRP